MTKRNCWTAALCLGLMLTGGHRLFAESPKQQKWSEIQTKMAAEGWTQIADGVFERQLGPTKVEHLGYGREGLTWHIGELTRQLETMMREYESYPSEDLAKIVDDLSVTIAKAKRELKSMPKGLTKMTAAVVGPSCSSICYGATADAYHLPGGGTGAVADAKFNSTCGYTGETYAYAYAKATLNGTTTVLHQTDPSAGTSITSHAAAVVNGGAPCSSNANAYAQSTALGISYSTSDTNTGTCPMPSCTVTITGTTSETFTFPGGGGCRTRTWNANLSSGCTAPYQWKRNNTVVGSGSSYTGTVCAVDQPGFRLDLTANGVADPNGHYVSVTVEPIEDCNPTCQ